MSLLALVFATAIASTPRVAIESTPLAPALRSILAPDLPAGALVEGDAELGVTLVRDGPSLRLVLRHAGRTVLERRIATKDGERPAIRAAALVVVEAHARLGRDVRSVPAARTATVGVVATSSVSATPGGGTVAGRAAVRDRARAADDAREGIAANPAEDVRPADSLEGVVVDGPASVDEPGSRARAETSAIVDAPPDAEAALATSPDGPAPLLWSFGGGAAAAWWARPGTAQLGLTLAARRRVGPVELGVRAALYGLCCALALDDDAGRRVDGSPLQVWGGIEAALPLTTLGPVVVAPVGTLGFGVDRVAATATAFVGDPVEETYSVAGILLRAGVELSLPITQRVSLDLAAGILAKTPRLVARLPEPFGAESADLDAGSLLPWAELGVRARAF